VSYVLEPAPLWVQDPRRAELEATIVLVGCGGTGGFLAESVCRLLLDRRAAVFLVDPDRVEPVNVSRQAFELADVGRWKAEVLAERLVCRFGMEVGYSVLPYDARVHDAAFARPTRLALVVGAVDNAPARQAIAATLARHGGYTASGDRASPILWLEGGSWTRRTRLSPFAACSCATAGGRD
jgi:tRNA A37 threonylcarbamoyladenosine dehydratase